MLDEMTLEQLGMMAARAGLRLSEDELQRLLPGVNRSRNQVAELRDLLSLTVELAGIFTVSIPHEK